MLHLSSCPNVFISWFFSLCFNSYTPVSHNIKTSCLTQCETPIVTYWVMHKGPLGVSCGFWIRKAGENPFRMRLVSHKSLTGLGVEQFGGRIDAPGSV